jgi:hypothetical protein
MWTKYADQGAAGANNSGTWSWVGVVTTAGTNVTVTLARPTGSNIQWGFTTSVIRGSSGIGVRFEGNNGTASGAPGVTQTVSANSLLTCQVNDWNAIDGASRTWRTVNGSPITEASYYRSASTHTIYGGYVADSGAGGSVTMGLTAPATQRWVMSGFEFLGSSTSGANQALAGTVAGTSAASGSIAARVALAGAVAATTALAGAIGVSQGLGGSVPATSAVAGAITSDHPLGGTVAATTATTGAPVANHPLAGSVASTTAVSGSLGTRQSLAGSVTATSDASGTFTLRAPLAGSIAAVTTTSGTPTSRQGITGTVNAVSSAAGTFFEAGAQVYPLAGNVTATTATAGSITARHPLAGSAAGTSTTVGTMTVRVVLTGSSSASSSVTGSPSAGYALSGQVEAVSGTSGAFAQPPTNFTGRILAARITAPTALGVVVVPGAAGDLSAAAVTARLSILKARGVIT